MFHAANPCNMSKSLVSFFLASRLNVFTNLILQIQQLTDEFSDSADVLLDAKTKELMRR